jgi:hypothetical protein
MNRQDIELLLQQAKASTHHSHYVIIGSLSILGAIESPPSTMTMSVDVDLYPRDDPGRAGEIAEQLGLGSDFEQRHGFYADAVSPRLPALPTGWDDRMVPVEFKDGVTAWFLDPNDAAVSKYARSEPRDREWIRAGLGAGILSMPTIEYRLPSAVMDDHENQIARQSILEDKAWMKSILQQQKRTRQSRRDPGVER